NRVRDSYRSRVVTSRDSATHHRRFACRYTAFTPRREHLRMTSHHHRSEASADLYRDMMTRFLGSVVMQAFDDPDVTEVYTNPHDQRIWIITHSEGRVNTGARIEPFAEAERC